MKIDENIIGLTVQDAAAQIGMSVDYVRALCRNGELGFKKLGTRTIIPREELLDWFNSQNSGPRR